MTFWLPALLLPRQATLELGRQWGRTSLWWLKVICGLSHEFRGLRNIPEGAAMVACKHQSVWETFTLPLLFSDFFFILKRELIYIPFFGWYLLSAEQVAVERQGRQALAAPQRRGDQTKFAQGRAILHFSGGHAPPGGRAARI